MADGAQTQTTAPDLIRWTFTIDPAHRVEIEEHLADMGLDVLIRDDSQFIVTWEEPDRTPEEVVEESGPFTARRSRSPTRSSIASGCTSSTTTTGRRKRPDGKSAECFASKRVLSAEP